MNKENLQWLVLSLVVVGLVGLSIVVVKQNIHMAQFSRSLAVVTAKPQEQPVSAQPANAFVPLKNKVGDVVAGMKVVSTGPAVGNRPMAADNVHAKLTGQVTLSGTYDYSFSDFSGEDTACFTVTDPNEKLKLPVVAGASDETSAFCFSNLEKAKAAFGPKYGTGQATITIDNYQIWFAPAEVWDQAELLDVVSK